MLRWFPALLLIAAGCSDYDLNLRTDLDQPDDEADPSVDPDSEVEDPEDPGDDPEDPVVEGEPVADAGPDAFVKPLEWVTLDAGGSRDPNGLYPLKFQWTLVGKPADSHATIEGSTELNPRIWADLAGDYVIELTVQNSDGVWDSTPDQVVITAEPTDGFYVQLSWDTESDQDLHLMRSGAHIYDVPGDCSWCNMTPSWGRGGSGDDPSLDWDTIDAYGPETTTIDEPAADTYTIAVHYYGQDGDSACWWDCPDTEATVRLYIHGVLVETWVGNLTDQGDVWTVATIDWPSESVGTVDTMGYTSLIGCN